MLRNVITASNNILFILHQGWRTPNAGAKSGTNYICQQHHTSQAFSILPFCSVPGHNPLHEEHICCYSLYAVQAPASTCYMHTERQLQKNTTLYYHGNYFELLSIKILI